jgi:uncharacterized protein (TIGR02001 family)
MARLSKLSMTLAMLAGSVGSAAAEDRRWTAEATLASEYISKGVGRSDGEPHVGVQVQRQLSEATYAGAWAGTLRSPLGADAEAHLYVGWQPRVGAWRLDLRPILKVLSAAQAGAQTEQFEMRVDAARAVAGNRLRLRLEHSPDGFGASQASTWLEANLTRKLGDSGWSASAGVGRREQEVGRDYTAWNVGLQRRLTDALAAELRWIDTDQHGGGREYKGRFVAGLHATWR